MQISTRLNPCRGEENPVVLATASRRSLERGTTLVEVLIVVAIIALVAGGVGFFAFPQLQKAQKKTAKTGALTIRQAVQTWMASEGDGCPTVAQLLQEKILDPATDTQDPWGGDYTVTCEPDSQGTVEIIVTSSGPDKKAGSADDIRVPTPKAGQGEQG